VFCIAATCNLVLVAVTAHPFPDCNSIYLLWYSNLMVIPKYITRMLLLHVLIVYWWYVVEEGRGYQHITFSYIALCVTAKALLHLVNL